MNLRRRVERLERREFGLGGAEAETPQSRQLRTEERSRNQFRLALRSFVQDLWELLGDRERARTVTDGNVAQERREAWQGLDAETREEYRQAARLLLEREEARHARPRRARR